MVDDQSVSLFLEHVGVKGMKWGHRKPRDEAARAKQFGGQKDKKKPNFNSQQARIARDKKRETLDSTYAQRKIDSDMSMGEITASLLLAGPVGLVAVKTFKVARARDAALGKVGRPNASSKSRRQIKAESHMNLGEKAASAIVGGPLGMAVYKSGKVLVVRNRGL